MRTMWRITVSRYLRTVAHGSYDQEIQTYTYDYLVHAPTLVDAIGLLPPGEDKSTIISCKMDYVHLLGVGNSNAQDA